MWLYLFAAAAVLFYFLVWQPKPGARKPSPRSRVVANDKDTYSDYKSGQQHWTSEPNGEVEIKFSKKGVASEAPLTVMEVFKSAVKRFPGHPALKVENEVSKGVWNWETVSWQDYHSRVMQFARALVSQDFQPFDAVNIIGFNSPEWFYAHMGAIAAGGKGVGVYSSNGPDSCKFISKHCDARFVIVEGEDQLEKYVSIHKDLPKLKGMIVYRSKAERLRALKTQFTIPCYSFDEFMRLGGDESEAKIAEVDKRIMAQRPGHCCSLIYTSGTTGDPKAVMISNDNATWTARALTEIMTDKLHEIKEANIVSYLPLSHIAAQLEDVYAPFGIQSYHGVPTTVWFARPDALKGTLGVTLKAARPTLFFGVPRVWEKMQEKMLSIGKSTKGLKKAIASFAKARSAEAFENAQVGGSGDLPAGFGLAQKVVLSKIREALGFDRCHFFLTGAAPIGKNTLNYFGSLDIYINELYGMSECTGPQTVSRSEYFRVGSCGPNLPGCELKIDHDPDRDKEGEGEICYRGRHIMMGYMKNPEKTRESIDPDGWLHSGDVGRVDENGLLYITSRIKELIVTAGGENVAPVPVEEKLMDELPAISGCMMVGDKRKFNSVLFTLRCEPDGSDGFTDKLADEAAQVSSAKTVEEAKNDKKWTEYLQKGINAYNSKAVSNAAKIQKFAILPKTFSVPGGELTPTLKLKRPVVEEKYADIIDGFYQ